MLEKTYPDFTRKELIELRDRADHQMHAMYSANAWSPMDNKRRAALYKLRVACDDLEAIECQKKCLSWDEMNAVLDKVFEPSEG
jgi:hypothetical protein